jgi:hypothetical protein
MKISSRKLLFPILPKENESLVGLLMRAAESNGIKPASIISDVTGRAGKPPGVEHIEALAHVFGCDPMLLPPLLGFVTRKHGERRWHIDGHVLTKEYFIRSRSMAVCPHCLAEDSYLRATWELTPYVACPRHFCLLIDACPGCDHPLRWNRGSIAICDCGFDLREAKIRSASAAEMFPGWLIDSQLGYFKGAPHFTTQLFWPQTVRWVMRLSLDELFRSIWFFGHCLADFEHAGAGHAIKKGRLTDSVQIVRNWHDHLQDWPNQFYGRLHVISDRKLSQTSAGILERAFGPVQTYVMNELKGENFRQLRQAYKHFVFSQWRKYLRPPKSIYDGQLELFWN